MLLLDDINNFSMRSSFYLACLFFLLCGKQSVVAQSDTNLLDEKGNKNGIWKGYYPESKRLRYQGIFEHGKEVGTFNFYDDTKAQSIIATREFDPKTNSVYTTFYDQDKNKVSEGKAINRLNEGVWKYYHQASKEIMTLENYKNGKLEGLRSVFYPNTKIAEETNYVNGIKNGPYKKYSDKGTVLEETLYKNGEYDGPAIFRDPLGNIVAKGMYVKGVKRGMWQFYENGKLVSEENMSKVKKLVKPKSK